MLKYCSFNLFNIYAFLFNILMLVQLYLHLFMYNLLNNNSISIFLNDY